MVRLRRKKRQGEAGGAAPTCAEWEAMAEYGAFIVRDEDGDEHAFRKGDCAIILPHGRSVGERLEMHEYWVAKIRGVRARGDSDVWARVQWYWAPTDVRRVLKPFDAALCSPYERVFSDDFDFVSSASFDATVPMHKLNDDDLRQPHIPWDAFYTRYTFEHRPRLLLPKPGAHSCLCDAPYAPTDPRPHMLMHFCPRPTCRRFFHAACLLAANALDPDAGTASRKRRLLSASPDSSDSDSDLLANVNAAPPAKKRTRTRTRTRGRGRARARRGRGPGNRTSSPAPKDPDPDPDPDADTTDADATDLDILLAALPPDLVAIAEQPIVRGAAWQAGGVGGNVAAVVCARRVVYRAVSLLRGGGGGEEDREGEGEGEYALEGWEARVGDVGRAVVELDAEVHAQAEVEEEKKTRTRKGTKRRRTRKDTDASASAIAEPEHAHAGVLPFLCPLCRGAI